MLGALARAVAPVRVALGALLLLWRHLGLLQACAVTEARALTKAGLGGAWIQEATGDAANDEDDGDTVESRHGQRAHILLTGLGATLRRPVAEDSSAVASKADGIIDQVLSYSWLWAARSSSINYTLIVVKRVEGAVVV